jgi:hypothetical protein
MATLEQLLVDTRLLTTAQLATAQRDANVRHKRLAAAIIDLGLVDERRFAEWLAKVTELPVVDPLPAGAIATLQHRISPQLAREYQVVPLAIERDALTIATMNPLDQGALEILRHATGLHIRAVIAMYGAISDALERFYPEEDRDLTLMRRPADLSRSTIAAPMPLGSETVLAGVGRPFAKHAETDETRVLPSSAPVLVDAESSGDEQLDRIERHLADLVNAVEKLQRRVDAMDATIARVLSRK